MPSAISITSGFSSDIASLCFVSFSTLDSETFFVVVFVSSSIDGAVDESFAWSRDGGSGDDDSVLDSTTVEVASDVFSIDAAADEGFAATAFVTAFFGAVSSFGSGRSFLVDDDDDDDLDDAGRFPEAEPFALDERYVEYRLDRFVET